MKMLQKRPASRGTTEHIEMELFASEESRAVVSVQETEEDYCSYYRHLEHPLVSVTEVEVPEAREARVQTPPEKQFKLKRVLSVGTKDLDDYPLVPDLKEDMEIELERFPAVASLNQVTRVKWRRVDQQRTGLVVKDVICLPRGHLPALPDRHGAPPGEEMAAMAALGRTARIAIDFGWSTREMENRLVSHFHGHLGRRFSFAYLQSVQGSQALFVPDPPVEGWTGEQVLRMCGHGPLYILSRHVYTQAESDWPERRTQAGATNTFPLGVSTESWDETQPAGENLPPEHSHKMDLDQALRRFRRRAADPGLRLPVSPRWGELLRSALEVVGRRGFCYRATPVLSVGGAGGLQLTLTEFFRRVLSELQQSCVFEGPPGRLFLTYDLTALEEKKYYKAGVLIGWSLAHGGPGPQCIHPTFYQLLCGQNAFLHDFDWRDVTNPEAQVRMKRLQSPTSLGQLSDRPCDRSSRLSEKDSTDLIYASMVKQYIYHRVASMVAQFTDGLDSCGGLWETVCANWEAFAPVMTGMGQTTSNTED